MATRIEEVGETSIPALDGLFCSDRAIAGCWCMWFVIPVKEFHEGKNGANKTRFIEMMNGEKSPMGLVAYEGEIAVGWCAVGPRARYRRALKIPSYRGGPKEDDARIWLVPCLYVRADLRESGLGSDLLKAAVALATDHGADAIEGMPFSSGMRRTGGDTQVGFEGLFRRCGFTPVRRPSETRVVMRKDLRTGGEPPSR